MTYRELLAKLQALSAEELDTKLILYSEETDSDGQYFNIHFETDDDEMVEPCFLMGEG